MTKLEELTWEQLCEQVTYIMEGRSSATPEMREMLIARALVEIMSRLDQPLSREDLIEHRPQCDGSGWIADTPTAGRGITHRTSCTCKNGHALTAAGCAVAEVARVWR